MRFPRWPKVATISLVALELVAALPAPKYFNRFEKAKYALCVVDVLQATSTLGESGLAVNEAIEACEELQETEEKKAKLLASGEDFDEHKLEEKKAVCAASIAGLLDGFIEAAEYLSGASSNCAADVNLKAYCSADVTGLLGGLAELAEAGAAMHVECSAGEDGEDEEEEEEVNVILGERRLRERRRKRRMPRRPWLISDNSSVLATTRAGPSYTPVPAALWGALMRPDLNITLDRRLGDVDLDAELEELQAVEERMKEAMEQAKEDRKKSADTATCFFNALEAALYLARGGLALNSAVKECSHFALNAEGSIAQMACSVDLNGIIGSFAQVAKYIAVTVTACPSIVNKKAACAASIIAVVAGIQDIAVTGSSFDLTCGGKAAGAPGLLDGGLLPLRRLSEDDGGRSNDGPLYP